MRLVTALLILVIGMVMGFFFRDWFSGSGNNVKEDTTLLLERIRTVAKLVTVEGEFANIHNYSDYEYFDFGPFRKTAVVKVNAKVSVGYDLGKMRIEASTEDKKLIISDLPKPEIISIDHNLSWFDIDEGLFNSFSESDLNSISTKTRNILELTVKGVPKVENAISQQDKMANFFADKIFKEAFNGGNLINKASEEGIKILDLMELIARDSGYEIVYIDNPYNDPKNLDPSFNPKDSLLK